MTTTPSTTPSPTPAPWYANEREAIEAAMTYIDQHWTAGSRSDIVLHHLARVRHDDSVSESGIAEFQDDVRDMILSILEEAQIPGDIDGGGCDSSDWRDFTLDEIRQGFNRVLDHYFQKDQAQLATSPAPAAEHPALVALQGAVAAWDSLLSYRAAVEIGVLEKNKGHDLMRWSELMTAMDAARVLLAAQVDAGKDGTK